MALFPLSVTVEILINGTWTDISRYVYQRNTVQITGGKSAVADQAEPARMTLTLNNRDGRFSPNYSGGAYYPFLLRNTQIRLSVSDTSSSGNVYSGFRYWGEVHHWPPMNDLSGKDVWVDIEARGPLRRIRAHGGKGSALTRYYRTLTGSLAPVAYWPCEEDPDTTIVGAGIDGGTNMNVTAGTPKWKHISDFNGSAPIGVINRSTWDGLTGSFGSSGDDSYTNPGLYAWVSPFTGNLTVKCWGAGGGGGGGELTAAGGGGGGGGEEASSTTVAVTQGTSYAVLVGTGGTGGAQDLGGGASDGTAGTASSFTGDAVTITANGGGGGLKGTASAGGAAGAAGTGSAAPVHNNGGAGGAGGSTAGGNTGGGGGGSSGGTAAAGNNGTAGGANGGAGGAAPTGGGKGGRGGDPGFNSGQTPGTVPGGGGGGGAGFGGIFGGGLSGASGAAGKVELVYTPVTTATTNVIRFIKLTPKHGGNPGKVLLDVETSGTIKSVRVLYQSGGKLQLKGFSSASGGGSTLFDSTAQAWGIDGQTVMISIELQNSGANVAWAFKAVIPGASTLLGSTSGTATTASVGNVTEVIVAPSADITKTAIGHISVQYAKVPLLKVSRALHGHHSEMGVDRFVRLLTEQALGGATEFSEASDHWGFEASTQSWVGTNAALTNPTTGFTPVDTDTTPNLTNFTAWPPDGTHSLLLTCNGAGQPFATSPTGTSGQNVIAGDIVSVNCEAYTPAAKNSMFIGILWYQASGAAAAHAEDDSADVAFAAGEMKTLRVTATAPVGAAFFAVKAGDHETPANGQLIYIDHVRSHPRMGPQTRKRYHEFLEEIEHLDAGILKEARELFGLKYRTRFRMINQPIALTLDYSAGTISPPLTPTVDDKLVKNHIIVHRHKGSKVEVSLGNGIMSVLEPPAGTGRHKHTRRVAAERDEQLLALAAHLLAIGTGPDERFPTVTVNLARAGILNNAVAPLMSAIAGIEIGDYIRLTNLPFWFPSATAKQLVVGYTETINAYEWTVTWNCEQESPWEITVTNIRRW